MPTTSEVVEGLKAVLRAIDHNYDPLGKELAKSCLKRQLQAFLDLTGRRYAATARERPTLEKLGLKSYIAA